jgi:UDP-N-acetylmuramoyl-L-alanyl-D-glutamate--2,6-diaminopimelate ligase
MQLKKLVTATQVQGVEGTLDRDVTSIAYDSRMVRPGAIFFALPGTRTSGADYVEQAVERGAEVVVSEQEQIRSRATNLRVANARVAMADLAAAFYGNPSKKLKVAGVTGTNGKTTTTFLIKHLCDTALKRCGLIGTVRYEVGERVLPAARTTPESADVQDLLWQMGAAGCKTAAMEVSSHALVQERVRGVDFEVGVFTNLTQDHLDFHGSMDAYFDAKCRLFEQLAARSGKAGRGVVNLDDRFGSQLIQRFRGQIPWATYGQGIQADYRASNVRMDLQGTQFQLDAHGKSYLVRLPLIGMFNVYNALAAIAAAHGLGVEVRAAVQALANAPAVPGRMEPVPVKRQYRVFVDYAHTDDALANVLRTCRELKPARLIVVFGCGGNRDRGKRARMGAVAEQLADYAVVTSDNPRGEDPMEIISEIRSGMTLGRHEVVVDRREAICRAVALARPRDIVLIAGKGHEQTQEIQGVSIPFNDVSVARRAVEERTVELEA